MSQSPKRVYNAIELFAGIGGIRLGFQEAFGDRIKFLWANDINKSCAVTYQANFGAGSMNCDDINETLKHMERIPQHDLLLAGFPCQPFSIAGEQKGFDDEKRGNLFYCIAKILEMRQPKAFLLENVGHFQHHNQGNTWKTVHKVLEEKCDYKVFFGQLNAKHYGVPQNRPRFYMAGFKDRTVNFTLPDSHDTPPKLSSILETNVPTKYFLSQKYLNGLKRHRKRHEAKGHGFGYKVLNPETDIAQALVVGGMGRERNLIQDKPVPGHWTEGDTDLMKRNIEGVRKVTPRECARLQGFKDNFTIPVADTQAYKQFANSVAVPVIRAIASNMLVALDSLTPNIQTEPAYPPLYVVSASKKQSLARSSPLFQSR